MFKKLIDVFKARIAALEVEAGKLVQDGKLEEAVIKRAFSDELQALIAEMEHVLDAL